MASPHDTMRCAPLARAHADRCLADDQELVEPVRELYQHVVDAVHSGRQVGKRSQPQENDARMRVPEPEHQLTEITVVRDQNALLRMSNREHLIVGQTGWVVAADSTDIVPTLL